VAVPVEASAGVAEDVCDEGSGVLADCGSVEVAEAGSVVEEEGVGAAELCGDAVAVSPSVRRAASAATVASESAAAEPAAPWEEDGWVAAVLDENDAAGRSGTRTSIESAPEDLGSRSTLSSEIHFACGLEASPR
jgi:hypothetical protein